jgi:penicillin-binding protein-related factor A (putative recombinase)
MRKDTFNTGIASEYLILSKFYRMELEAYMSQGNKKSVDIRVIKKDGQPISVDVKAVRGYSSLVVNNVVAKDNHFVVFVIYNNKFEDVSVDPEIYVVPTNELAAITETYGEEKRVMKGKLGTYKNKWNYFLN